MMKKKKQLGYLTKGVELKLEYLLHTFFNKTSPCFETIRKTLYLPAVLQQFSRCSNATTC